jgi:hypothetical protein
MDMTKLRSKLQDLKSQGGDRKVFWKPKPGKQVIRIVPYKFTPDWPFVELYFHYNISDKTLISPASFGDPDPIKEFSEKLQSTGDRDEWKHGKQIEPKRRTYVAILVRGEESEGVKIWGFGTQIYETLLTKMDDPDWGDITHPLTGRDITVTFEKATGPNTYPKTTIDVKPVQSKVTEDSSVLESLANMPDISQLWKVPTYDELKEILNTYVETGEPVKMAEINASDGSESNGSGAGNGVDDGTKSAVDSGTEPVSSEPSTSDGDVMAAFGSYFGKGN